MYRKSYSVITLAFAFLLLGSSNLWAQPVVDLGQDTLVCGGLTLDAGNAGATYAWSTSATSQTIFADTTGIYWVDVTDGSGTTRDSIRVKVVQSPTLFGLKDTTLCGGEVTVTPPLFGSDRLLWYDSLSGGNLVHIGDSWTSNREDSATYYLSAMNLDTSVHVGPTPLNEGSFAALRGLRFDAFQPFILESVTVGLNGPATFSIYRANDRGRIIDSVVVSATPDANGMAVIPLYLPVPAGNNLQLLAGNFQQGSLYLRRSGLAFPYVVPGVLQIERGLFVSTIYYYFFDWKVSTLACATPRQAYNVNVLPTPEVNLGPDTIVCGGPYVLDATFPGASYQWGGGQTTPTISADTNDIYSVNVSIGLCNAADSVELEFVPAPGSPTVTDTAICGPASVPLQASAPAAGKILWYDAPAGGNLIGIQDDDLSLDVQSDTTVYASNRLIAPYPFRVGSDQVPGGYFNQRRGLEFDVEERLIIEEVTMYARSFCTFDVLLVDRNGQVLDSLHVSSPAIIGPGVPFTVSLGFEVLPGQDYLLLADNIQGSTLGILNPGPSYPLNYAGVMEITNGFTIGSAYYYFFDWVIAKEACEGPRIPKRIDVALPLNLPEALYACGDTVISAGIQAASYQWNTGSTNPDLAVDSSGVYILTVTDGQTCTIQDTIDFTRAAPAGLADDGVLCGMVLTTNYGSESAFLWSTTDTTPTLTLTGPGQYSVEIREPRGCTLRDTIDVTGFATFPVVDLGGDRSVCIADTLDAGNAGSSYRWSTGDTSQTLVVRATGFYSVAVTNAAGCARADTVAVTVTPRPTADFSSNSTGFSVCFFNFSSFGTYIWNFGDGASSSAVQPCHTYVDTGTYTVSLIVQNQCGRDTVTRTVRITRPSALEKDLETLALEVFPNPARDEVYVDIPVSSSGDITRVTLVDVHGRSLLRLTHRGPEPLRIPLENLGQGMYLIRVWQGTARGNARLFITE